MHTRGWSFAAHLPPPSLKDFQRYLQLRWLVTQSGDQTCYWGSDLEKKMIFPKYKNGVELEKELLITAVLNHTRPSAQKQSSQNWSFDGRQSSHSHA